jgi:hypothetical protein
MRGLGIDLRLRTEVHGFEVDAGPRRRGGNG